jgi:hypothetical protein
MSLKVSRPLLWDCLAVLLLTVPSVLLLAQHPVSPDGAEMVTTALRGGVLHPSGMPLQAWINRLFVLMFSPAGWALSLLSWLCYWALALVFVRFARRLRLSSVSIYFAVVLLLTQPSLWTLALQPEKYLLLVLLTFATFAFSEFRNWRQILMLFTLFALSLAQHPAALVVLPALLVRMVQTPNRNTKVFWQFTMAAFFCATLTLALYGSLLWQRSDFAWVDWGHLSTWQDVIHHMLRLGFALDLNAGKTDVTLVSGLQSLVTQPIFGVFLVLGFPGFLWLRRTNREWLAPLGVTLAAGFVLLAQTQLSAQDLALGLGYVERYLTLLLPFVCLAIAAGVELILDLSGQKRRIPIYATLAVVALVLSALSFPHAAAVRSDLVEIYRQEIATELKSTDLYISQSDLELFYGVPVAGDIRFPIKNLFGFDWYRLHVAPVVDARVSSVMSAQPDSFEQFLRTAYQMGIPMATTTAGAFLPLPDIMQGAEQIGIVWRFHSSQRQLYTDNILASSVRLCRSLANSHSRVLRDGTYFLHPVLERMHFVFLGASDYLAATGQIDQSALAKNVAEVLIPGSSAKLWSEACTPYLARLPTVTN